MWPHWSHWVSVLPICENRGHHTHQPKLNTESQGLKGNILKPSLLHRCRASALPYPSPSHLSITATFLLSLQWARVSAGSPEDSGKLSPGQCEGGSERRRAGGKLNWSSLEDGSAGQLSGLRQLGQGTSVHRCPERETIELESNSRARNQRQGWAPQVCFGP